MRATEHRYDGERTRHELALRMIRHEARTRTIRSCTGLSDDRIRKLYKTYVETPTAGAVRRRRGKSPTQAHYFIRTLSLQHESSVLAALFGACGLLPQGVELPANRAARICDAYELYLQLLPRPIISFEHAWQLLRLLVARVELALQPCRRCGSQYVNEHSNESDALCPLCKIKGHGRRQVS